MLCALVRVGNIKLMLLLLLLFQRAGTGHKGFVVLV